MPSSLALEYAPKTLIVLRATKLLRSTLIAMANNTVSSRLAIEILYGIFAKGTTGAKNCVVVCKSPGMSGGETVIVLLLEIFYEYL